MNNLLRLFFEKLGSPQEQKTEKVALVVVYCMFLSFVTASLLGTVLIMQLGQTRQVAAQACVSNFSSQNLFDGKEKL
jgi:hypothetical protein